MNSLVLLFVIYILLITSGKNTQAQHENFLVSHINEKFPSSHITAEAKTDDGALWLGTATGLLRYNGVNFDVFNYSNNFLHLSSYNITSLLSDCNYLWIGTTRGLTRLNIQTGALRQYEMDWREIVYLAKTKSGNVVVCDNDGKIYLQQNNNFIFAKEIKNWKLKTYKNGFNLIPARDDILWIITVDNALCVDIKTGKVYCDYASLAGSERETISGTFLTQDDRLVLFHVNGGSIINTHTFRFEDNSFWKSLFEKVAGVSYVRQYSSKLWLAEGFSRFFMFDLSSGVLEEFDLWKKISPLEYLPYFVFSEDALSFWICCSNGIVKVIRTDKLFRSYRVQIKEQPDMPVTTRAIFPEKNGLYIGNYIRPAVLDTTTGNVVINKNTFSFSPAQVIEDGCNDFYVASETMGFCKYHSDADTLTINFYNNPFNVHIVEALCLWKFNSDLILIGSGNGLHLYSIETNTLDPEAYKSAMEEFPESRIFAIEQAADGRIWIGTEQGLLCMDKNLRLQKKNDYTSSYFWLTNNIRCLATTSDNLIVAGTIGEGMLIIDPAKQSVTRFTMHNGLPNDVIYSIVLENDSIVWLGTEGGLSRFNFRTLQCSNYFRQDGLIHEEFNTHSTYRSPNGEIYMGVMNGVVRFNPALFYKNHDEIFIRLTKLIRSSNKDSVQFFNFNTIEEIKLRRPDRMIEFQFALSSLETHDKPHFQYKLEGLSDDWVSIGPHNTLRFYQLPPGRFLLRIRGITAHSIITSNEVQIRLYVIPLFYETWWFLLIVFAISFCLLLLFFRYRMNQLKKILIMRNRIARDLHDDIGSTLSGMSMLSSVIQKEIIRDPSGALLRLQKMSSDSKQMLSSMDDIIWSVNPKNDQLEHLLARMRQFASQTLETKNIDVEISFDKTLGSIKLPMEIRRNLYLIFKESINNIAKYAEAKKVIIRMELTNSQLLLVIRDTGKGFDLHAANKGNGLYNIQQRAGEINATLCIETAPSKGTTILLQLPVPYRAKRFVQDSSI